MSVERRKDLQFSLFPEDRGLDQKIVSRLKEIKISTLPTIAVVTINRVRQGQLPFYEYSLYVITKDGAVACRVSADEPTLATITTLGILEDAKLMMRKAQLQPTILPLQFTVPKVS